MAQAKFIRIDSDSEPEKVKIFDNSSPYEGLAIGEVIEVECEDGQIRDYFVEASFWDFTHFGDTLIITIRPESIRHPPKNTNRN